MPLTNIGPNYGMSLPQITGSEVSAGVGATTSASISTSTVSIVNTYAPLILRFSLKYRPIHGWLVTIVCGLGLITNLLTIVVFTRAKLRRSPTSLILVSIAASDLLTMFSTLIFVIYFYIIYGDLPFNQLSPQRDTWAWVHFSNAHVLLTFTTHSISIWLNVYLACFRLV